MTTAADVLEQGADVGRRVIEDLDETIAHIGDVVDDLAGQAAGRIGDHAGDHLDHASDQFGKAMTAARDHIPETPSDWTPSFASNKRDPAATAQAVVVVVMVAAAVAIGAFLLLRARRVMRQRRAAQQIAEQEDAT